MPNVIAVAGCLVLAAQLATAEPVRVGAGLVEGVPSDAKLVVYRGIPFAAPPVGPLRWRAPQPPAPWDGVRKADRFSPACMQNAPRTMGPWTEEFMHQGEKSEDCLYLNVWAPPSPGKRPVFVWIYGGGFDQGSTAVALYDGAALARQGIVVVSFNYRVREFGFLVHPELMKESGRGVAGNYGLLDQIAALKWVQANIAAFGGDPGKVTIGGQSAGAASVMALMASPLATGLYHRAILQSGLNVANRWRPLAAAAADGERYMTAKGARTLQELRALPAESLMTPMEQMPYRPGPVVDGWVLPEPPGAVFARGDAPDIPILTGWTSDEGSSSPTYGKRTPEEFQKDVRSRVAANGWSGQAADDLVARFLRLYPATTAEAAGEAQKASARDQGLSTTYLLLRRRAARATAPAYTYLWTHPMPGPTQVAFGAFHSSELAYVFNSLDRAERPWEPRDREIAKTTSAYWANFVRTGDPNGPGLPAWPAFDPARPVTMELGEHFGVRPVADAGALSLFEAMLPQATPVP